MDHLRIERAHVVGYSLGGIIAIKLLTTHPERFLSAVLGGAAYRRSRSEEADRAADAAAREIESRDLPRAHRFHRADRRAAADRGNRSSRVRARSPRSATCARTPR